MSKLGDPTHRFKQLSSRPLERILRRSSLGRVSFGGLGFQGVSGCLEDLGEDLKSRLRYVGFFLGEEKKHVGCELTHRNFPYGQAPFSLLNGRANEKLLGGFAHQPAKNLPICCCPRFFE